jgi:hypothetical protein
VQEVSEWTFDGIRDYLRARVLVNEISADDPMGDPLHDQDGDLDSSRMMTLRERILSLWISWKIL